MANGLSERAVEKLLFRFSEDFKLKPHIATMRLYCGIDEFSYKDEIPDTASPSPIVSIARAREKSEPLKTTISASTGG